MKLSDREHDVNAPKSKEEQRKIAEFVKLRADMKAHLKTQSKNELIKQIFELIDLYNIERHKSLQGQSVETTITGEEQEKK